MINERVSPSALLSSSIIVKDDFTYLSFKVVFNLVIGLFQNFFKIWLFKSIKTTFPIKTKNKTVEMYSLVQFI